MKKMNESEAGYHFIQNTSNDSEHGNCKILLLDMEYHENWPAIFSSISPGIVYGSSPRTRESICPNFADKYDQLKEREFTNEELEQLLNGNSEVYDYFEAYGYKALK